MSQQLPDGLTDWRNMFYGKKYNAYTYSNGSLLKIKNLLDQLIGKEEIFVGIDPGYSGAMSFLDNNGKIIDILDIPLAYFVRKRRTKVKSSKNKKYKVKAHNYRQYKVVRKDFDVFLIDYLFCNISNVVPKVYIALEHVPPRISRNVSMGDVRIYSAWKMWHLYFLSLNFYFTDVYIADWRNHFQINSNTKELSLKKARSLYPDCDLIRLKKDHNRAEALLLARFAYDNCKEIPWKRRAHAHYDWRIGGNYV